MPDKARRLFVGIPVSLPTVDALSGACESLARRARDAKVPIRWLAPATYHITIKFLGWCRPEVVDAVIDALGRAAAGLEPVRFTTARLGAFPSVQKASVVWAGIEDGGRLATIAERVDQELAALGFAREQRRFHAHVTIGRVKELANVADVLLPLAEQVFSETTAPDLILFESKMKSTGSEYTPVVRIPLRAL